MGTSHERVEGSGRVAEVDGLRGLASVMILLSHYLGRGPELYPQLGTPIWWASLGEYRVQLFLIISGFVIPFTVRRGTAGRFLESRVVRLFPLYWLAVITTFLVTTIAPLPGRSVGVRTVLIDLPMVRTVLGLKSVDGAYWTLGVELLFYAQIAALMVVGLLRPERRRTTLGCWLAVIAVVRVVDLLVPDRPGVGSLVLLLGYMPWCLIGFALHEFRRTRDPWLLPIVVGAVAVVGLTGPHDVTAVTVMFVALFVLVLFGTSLGLTRAVPRFFGRISYALYLLHQNIGYVIMLALTAAGVSRALVVTIASATTILLAYLATRFVDEPVRAWLTPRLPSRRHAAAAPGAGRPEHPARGPDGDAPTERLAVHAVHGDRDPGR